MNIQFFSCAAIFDLELHGAWKCLKLETNSDTISLPENHVLVFQKH